VHSIGETFSIQAYIHDRIILKLQELLPLLAPESMLLKQPTRSTDRKERRPKYAPQQKKKRRETPCEKKLGEREWNKERDMLSQENY
jgi:hypothetical protein